MLGWYSAMHSAAVHLTLYSLSVYLRNAGRRRCGRVSCRIVRHRSWHSSCCALNGGSCPSGRICGTRPSHSRRLGISCGIARGNAARRRAADCRHIIRCPPRAMRHGTSSGFCHFERGLANSRTTLRYRACGTFLRGCLCRALLNTILLRNKTLLTCRLRRVLLLRGFLRMIARGISRCALSAEGSACARPASRRIGCGSPPAFSCGLSESLGNLGSSRAHDGIGQRTGKSSPEGVPCDSRIQSDPGYDSVRFSCHLHDCQNQHDPRYDIKACRYG